MGLGFGHGHHHGHHDAVTDDSAAGIRAVKVSLVVLAITAAAQVAVLVVSGSAALFADTVHNFSDALTAVPLWIAFAMSRRSATRRYTYGFGRVEDLAGLFVLAVGFPLADPIVGLVIACAIGAVLVVAARDVFRRLLDGVDPELVATAHRTLAERSDVRAVRQVRMRWVGHRLEADVELDVDSRLTLAEAHQLAHDAEHELAHAIPKLSHTIVHAYPAHEPALSS